MKKILFVLTFLCCNFLVFSQEIIDLKKINCDEFVVLPGTVKLMPEQKGPFYTTFLDGNQICVFTENGKIQKTAISTKRIEKFYSVGNCGQVYGIYNTNRVVCISSSGFELFTFELKDTPTAKPLCLEDGKILFLCKSSVSCYSESGTFIWKKNLNVLPGQKLIDLHNGTFLCFVINSKDNSVQVELLDVYGNSISTITLIPELQNLLSSPQNPIYISSTKDNIFIASLSNNQLLSVSTKDGTIQNKYSINFTNSSSFNTYVTQNSLVLQDNSHMILLDLSTKKITEILYKNKNLDFVSFSNNGNLLFFTKDWSVEVYKFSPKTYNSSYDNYKSFSDLYNEKFHNSTNENGQLFNKNQLKNLENYLINNKASTFDSKNLQGINTEFIQLYNDFNNETVFFVNEHPFFKSNFEYSQQIIYLYSLTGNQFGIEKYAKLIRNMENTEILLELIHNSKNFKFDNQNLILSEFIILLQNEKNWKNPQLLEEIINSTYEISKASGVISKKHCMKIYLSIVKNPKIGIKSKEKANILLEVIK